MASSATSCDFARSTAPRQTPLLMRRWPHLLGSHLQRHQIRHRLVAERVEYSSAGSEAVRDPIRLTILFQCRAAFAAADVDLMPASAIRFNCGMNFFVPSSKRGSSNMLKATYLPRRRKSLWRKTKQVAFALSPTCHQFCHQNALPSLPMVTISSIQKP